MVDHPILMKLHTEILPKNQNQVFEILANQEWLQRFYMAGGTCLALQIGHRQSIDFDFFTQETVRPHEIVQKMQRLGKFEIFDRTEDTLNGAINDVQVSFFNYEYPLVEKLCAFKQLKLAGMMDIALMKLEAISGRGNKKDFIDLYFLFQYFSLSKILEKYPQKYGVDICNHYHLLKSLAYFEDAEMQPMPRMSAPISWEKIKRKILLEATKVQKDIAMPL